MEENFSIKEDVRRFEADTTLSENAKNIFQLVRSKYPKGPVTESSLYPKHFSDKDDLLSGLRELCDKGYLIRR